VFLSVIAVVSVIFGVGAIASAQGSDAKRPYDAVMKDIASTVGSLRKELAAGDLVATASDAEKLERLFGETETFWAAFRTKDAISAAKGARETSNLIAAAAKARDLQKTQTAASGLGRHCTTCHDSHREQTPDKSYRIKP
jgi:cytochrome c556